jgi:hypothetical protein
MDKSTFKKCLMSALVAALGIALPGTAWADDCAPLQQTSSTICPQTITVEKPVLLHTTEKIIEKQVVIQKQPVYIRRASNRRHLAFRPLKKRVAYKRPAPKSMVVSRVIERTIEKPIMIEKPVLQQCTTFEQKVEAPVVLEEKCITQPAVIEQKALPVIEKKYEEDNHHFFHFNIF